MVAAAQTRNPVRLESCWREPDPARNPSSHVVDSQSVVTGVWIISTRDPLEFYSLTYIYICNLRVLKGPFPQGVGCRQGGCVRFELLSQQWLVGCKPLPLGGFPKLGVPFLFCGGPYNVIVFYVLYLDPAFTEIMV